jgi:6-hydroxycyclohex-1-ene-1-carbonyl-CoA dehydrogenase
MSTPTRTSWKLVSAGEPLQKSTDDARAPGEGEALVAIEGCGLCHTDLAFISGEVTPKMGLPLVPGHEIAGKVIATGPGAEHLMGEDVLAAAVIPCGECDLCKQGRGNICTRQIMPGNDCDGGFATHVTLPARGLYPVATLPEGLTLADVSVVADALSTSLQAVVRAGIGKDDFVVVIGAGGVGGYAVQIAAARGAHVTAVDVDPTRLEPLAQHGARELVDASGMSPRDLRGRIREIAKAAGAPGYGWKILECSGSVAGQQNAYTLLGPAATLGVVGYTREPGSFRLSNLMAFDAVAFGTWGCPPELYPQAVELVTSGTVAVTPFTEARPMEEIQEILGAFERHELTRRAILIPPSS